jgi:hypothetical protein
MNSNVNAECRDYAERSSAKRTSTPQKNSIKTGAIGTPFGSSSKKEKISAQTSAEKTPAHAHHRKTRSLQIANCSSPGKSRLNPSAIPVATVDVKACQAEIARYKLQQRKDMLAEKKMMADEWNNAKKMRKDEIEREVFSHEEQMTINKIEFKRMIEDEERMRKIQERKDRDEEFLALKEAKIRMGLEEKEREAEFLRREREKSMKKQREIEDKKEKIRIEREEKRKYFVEAVETAKKAEEDEEIRLKKENEFEYAQKISGNRELCYQSSLMQKSSLDRTVLIIDD